MPTTATLKHGVQPLTFSAAASGANLKEYFRMITKNVVFTYRMVEWITLLGLSLIIVATSTPLLLKLARVGTHGHARLLVKLGTLGFAAIMVAGIISTRFLRTQQSKLLSLWKRATNLSTATFPLNEMEMVILQPWAEKMLARLARAASEAFDIRDMVEIERERVEKEVAATKQFAAGTVVTPKELLALRRTVRKKERKYSRAVRNRDRVRSRANQVWKKYLLAWDLFTKKQPDGAGILTDYTGRHRDPDAYRIRVTKEGSPDETELMQQNI